MKKTILLLLLSLQMMAQFNITNTGSVKFHPTGITIPSDVYSIEVSAICVSNNAAHFGFGVKSATDFNSILYRGSTANVEELLFNTNTFKTPTWRTGGTGYVVGDKVSVKVYFEGNNIIWKVGKNDVWQTETVATKSFNKVGELYIVIRTASVWNDVQINIDTDSNYTDAHMNPNGDDSFPGAATQPVKTVARAKDIAKRNGIIIPQAGTYFDDLTFDLKRSFNMVGDSLAPARFVYGERKNTHTLMSGSSKVYEWTHTAITGTASGMALWLDELDDASTLIDSSEIHPLQRGRTYRCDNTRLTYLSSIAALEASNPNKGYWFQSGGKIYYTIPQGANLSEQVLVIPSKGNNTNFNYTIGAAPSGVNIVIKNIEFSYAPMDLSKTTFLIQNVKGSCVAFSTVFKFGYNTNSMFDNCEAYGSYFTTPGFGDGFSASVGDEIGVYLTDVFLKDCWAHDTADDCITNHKNTKITVQGGLFEYSGNGITPASGALAIINGAWCRKNSMYNISCVGTPAAGMNLTEAVIDSTTCVNSATNFYLYPQAGLKMTATNCTSIQGTGFHFSSGVNQVNCQTINN